MRILVASAQRLVVEAVRRAVSRKGWEVVHVSRDGDDALSGSHTEKPDLVLVDLDLPGRPLKEILKRIASSGPCVVLLAPSKAAVSRGYDLLGEGAADVLPPPTIDAEGELFGDAPFLSRLATHARLRHSTPAPEPVSRERGPAETLRRRQPSGSLLPADAPLVAIGASTGGPAALAAIFDKLPRDLAAAVIVVQHIEEGFAQGLASWLEERTGFTVLPAQDGETLCLSTAYVAAMDRHLVLSPDRRLRYEEEPRSAVHKPSVDVFFESLTAQASPGLAILLTGMGRDGAEGLAKLRRAGWSTVAQDEKTSIVWGMPRAAAEIGAAQQVLPLQAIAPVIEAFVSRAARRA